MHGLMSTAFSAVSPTDRPTNQCLHNSDSFKYYAYTFTYMIVFPVAFFCNIVALVVFLGQEKIRRSQRSSHCRVVMMNLAISDWSFSLTLPLRLAYYFQERHWNFPDWLCRLCTFGFYVNLYSSILFLTLLSLLRWFAVTKPFKHTVIRQKWVLIICLAIWVFVGVSSIPFLSEGVVYRDGIPRCFEPSSHSSWCRISIMNYIGLIFGFLLPFFTILSCYVEIIRRVTSHTCSQEFHTHSQGSSSHTKKRRHAVTLVTMVMVTFLICFLPYHLIRTLHLHSMCSNWSCGVKVPLQRAASITLCMAASNSVINPLLYYYFTKSFRKKVRAFSMSMRSGRGESFKNGSLTREFSRNKPIRRKQSEDPGTA